MVVPCCRSVSGSAVGHHQHSLSEYSHPPLTRDEVEWGGSQKKPLPISLFVWVVAPSSREAPICCLSLGFSIPNISSKKKKKRNLHNLPSPLFTNQPVYQKFGITLKCFKNSEARAASSGELLLSVSIPTTTDLTFGFFDQFLFTLD